VNVAMHLDGERARERAETFSVEQKKVHMHNIIRVVLNRGKSFGELMEMIE
jgi:hypothetical protein